MPRNTRQRQILLEELRKVTSHPTAAEVYELVRARLPHVSLGTVYRNLDLLARAHTIDKLSWSGGEARFDGNVTPHDHFRCVGCGRVDDAPGDPLAVGPPSDHDLRGYEVLGHRLEYFGLCPRCRSS
jgi:Fur family ferric uptake transcriptional regulator